MTDFVSSKWSARLFFTRCHLALHASTLLSLSVLLLVGISVVSRLGLFRIKLR